MSWYTNKLHDDIRKETTFWDNHEPSGAREFFEYAEYQWRLKDYRIAVEWLRKAEAEGYVLAAYRLGESYWHGYGQEKDEGAAQRYFARFMAQAGVCYADTEYTELALYFQGNCYANGWGTEKDVKKAETAYLSMGDASGDAMEALGLLYKDEISEAGHEEKAWKYFLKALELGCMGAPFRLYEMSGCDLVHFAYQRPLFEHFSFILGRLMRVVELHPCKEYYDRLGRFYETALPNDYQWNIDKFKKLAEKYYALGESC